MQEYVHILRYKLDSLIWHLATLRDQEIWILDVLALECQSGEGEDHNFCVRLFSYLYDSVCNSAVVFHVFCRASTIFKGHAP